MVVFPLFIFSIGIATRLIMLLLGTLTLMHDGRALAALWTHVTFFESSVALLYAVIIAPLWHAPVYAWLLLVSAWAKRAAFLWAVLPLMLVVMFEKIAFGTR